MSTLKRDYSLLRVAILVPILWGPATFVSPAHSECINQLRTNETVHVTYESGRVARITGDADPDIIVERIVAGGSDATPSARYIRAGVLTIRSVSTDDDAQTKFRPGSQMPNRQFSPGNYAVHGTVYRNGMPERSVSIALSIQDQHHDIRIGACSFSTVVIMQIIKVWEGKIGAGVSQDTFLRTFVDRETMIPLRYERYADAKYQELVFSDMASEVAAQR